MFRMVLNLQWESLIERPLCARHSDRFYRKTWEMTQGPTVGQCSPPRRPVARLGDRARFRLPPLPQAGAKQSPRPPPPAPHTHPARGLGGRYLGWHSLPAQNSWTGSGRVRASQ